MTSMTDAGGVRVDVRHPSADRTAVLLDGLVADDVAGRLAARDVTLWGPAAEAEAAGRLGWLDVPGSSRHLAGEVARIGGRTDLDHVVLLGMGGSSLAAEVVCRANGLDLTVLDTTDCDQTNRALADRLDRTLVIVSSKSGGTIETDSQFRVYRNAFREAGLTPSEIARHIVAVTDPGSYLAGTAADAGFATVLADPAVGGRFSALTAFGLVPAGLLGLDVDTLLDDAESLGAALRSARDNPGLVLGAALAAAAPHGNGTLAITERGTRSSAFGDWLEQLLAESTGKDGRGILPVALGTRDARNPFPANDFLRAVVGTDPPGGPDRAELEVSGPLGAQFLLWEYATAVAGRLLGVNPFDQPNVEESKANTMALLGSGQAADDEPSFVDGAIAVHTDPAARDLLAGVTRVADLLDALPSLVPDDGYLALMAYLDRVGDARVADLRDLLAARTTRQVSFGWGPRFLHSTGQYHKGGPATGVFCQITGAVSADIPVPGRPYTLAQVQRAQAAGDVRALRRRGRAVVRIHLLDREEGLAQLLGHGALVDVRTGQS